MSRSPGAYSWLPGFLRRFLNLDDDLPDYGPSSYRAPSSSAPGRPSTYAAPRSASYNAPEPQRFTPTFTPSESPRFSPAPPPGAPAPGAPPAPTYVPPAGAPVSPGANLPGGVPEGYVQPVGYLFRSYARGALPPQGLEQFTRETRATFTDVWNFYSYWTRFQTEELVRLGRELYDIVFDDTVPPAGVDPSTGSAGTIRRIKVTTANGNGDEKRVDRVATTTTIDPPPETTPAAPPAPPPATAVFSPTVTADDAQIPPGGVRDVAAPTGAAETTREAVADAVDAAKDAVKARTETTTDLGDSAAAAAAATGEAVRDATDSARDAAADLGSATRDAVQDATDAAKDLGDNLRDKK